MKEIRIVGNHLNNESHELLKELYNEVLQHDKRWHFFWEGKVIFLRCTDEPSIIDQITSLLRKKKVKYEVIPSYKENIPITKKYLNQFKNIFHEFSVLRMETEEEEFLQIAERVIHCFLNTNRRYLMEERFLGRMCSQSWAITLFEPMVLNFIASQRAYTIGRL